MLTKQLGRDGPHIPALGLGLMGLSSFYGTPPPDEERYRLLDKAHELGCTHWDSAAMYGDSEELLGRWFQRTGKRKDIFLTTKFGNHVTPDGGREIRNEPEYIVESLEKSLARLKTDYVDLFYCHRISGKTPIEDIVETMKTLVSSGKVRYLGLSECGVDTLRRASKIHTIQAYQIEYSPFSMDIEKPGVDLAKTCRELGIGIVAYSPLGRGMLTGQYRSVNDFESNDLRRSIPRFSAENFPRNLELVEKMKAMADSKGCTPGQLTLAWMMKQDSVFPIPGTKRMKYLEENIGSDKVELTEGEQAEIRQAVELATVHGTRMGPELMGVLVRDTPPR